MIVRALKTLARVILLFLVFLASPTVSGELYVQDASESTIVQNRHHRQDRTRQQPQQGYWSLKCVRQRQSSVLQHTRDCDSPAYSGEGYPENSRRFRRPHSYTRHRNRYYLDR